MHKRAINVLHLPQSAAHCLPSSRTSSEGLTNEGLTMCTLRLQGLTENVMLT